MNHDVRAKQIANDLRGLPAATLHTGHLTGDSTQVRELHASKLNSSKLRGSEIHRGVLALEEAGLCAVFARDNYRLDPRTQHEVRLLFRDAYERDCPVLGFAVDDLDGSCWAMIVVCDDLDWMNARLEDAFVHSHGLDKLTQSS